MQIVYCDKCGVRVPEQDIAAGTAVQTTQGQCVCAQCAAATPQRQTPAKPPVRPATREAQPVRVGRATTGAAHAVSSRAPEAPAAFAAAKKSSNTVPIIVGGVLGIFGLIMIMMALAGRGKTSARPEPPKTVSPDQPKTIKPEQPKVPERKTEVVQPKFEPVKPEPEKKELAPAAAIDDIRESYAKRKWADLKTAVERGSLSPRSAYRQVRDFVGTYASTAAGKDAAEFLKTLKTDDPPPPPGKGVVAQYGRDFKQNTPGPGWRYMWNEGGAVGTAANYKDMVWNDGRQGYAGGPQQYPVGGPAAWARLGSDGGHPGQGSEQGAGVDRYAIAAYTLQAGQGGKLAISGSIVKPHSAGTGVVLHVYVGDALKESLTVAPAAQASELALYLGTLKEGDTVYVAVGPDRQDGNDSFTWDFALYLAP